MPIATGKFANILNKPVAIGEFADILNQVPPGTKREATGEFADILNKPQVETIRQPPVAIGEFANILNTPAPKPTPSLRIQQAPVARPGLSSLDRKRTIGATDSFKTSVPEKIAAWGSAWLKGITGQIPTSEFKQIEKNLGADVFIENLSDASGIALAGITIFQGGKAVIDAVRIAKSQFGNLSPTIRGIKRGLSKIIGGPEKPIQDFFDGKINGKQAGAKLRKFTDLNPDRLDQALNDAELLRQEITGTKRLPSLGLAPTVIGKVPAIQPPSVTPASLLSDTPPPVKSPAVSNFITKAVVPLKSEAGRIPIETIVPGIDSLKSVSLAVERNSGRISKAFTRFSELDSLTTQAFINISEGDMEFREKAVQASVDIFKDHSPEVWEATYKHLQEPTKFPAPSGTESIIEQSRDIMKWSFTELNKRELTSDKDIAALENAVDNDLPISDNLKPKLAVPKWPDNEIEALTKKEKILQLRLSATKDPIAADNYISELATIAERVDKLENVVYFHQISTKPGLHLKDRIANRVISKKPSLAKKRTFATREDAIAAGFKVADLPTAVADTIYETNRSLMMDDFIKHINRNEDFAQRADLAPKDWVHIDKHRFPAGQFKKYHPAIADAINEVTYTSQRSDFGKAYDWVNTNAKVIGFYNPLFMGRFNISQGIRAAGITSQLKLPKALKIWKAKGDTYNLLRRNGLFNNVFDLKPTMEDMTKGLLEQINSQKNLSKKFKEAALANLNPINLARNTWKLLNEGTWKIDEVQRIATWLAMRDNSRLKRHYSDFEIIELVNDFHANYGKVPKATRQALNRVVFTPTYKISMARILGRMHREAKALWPSLLRHYAMKLAFTVGLPVAANEYLKSQEIDKRTKVEGYRFIVGNPKGKKETVFSLSDPLLELTKIENRPFFRTIEFNLAAVPAATSNLIFGPLFRNKNDPEWKTTLDAFFKTGAPVIKELFLWQRDDLETYQKYMQGLGLAFVYKRNRKKLPEKPFRQTFLEALDLWVERKKLFPPGKLERRLVAEGKKLITVPEKKKKR